MRRKILHFLIVFISIFIFVFTLASCGKNNQVDINTKSGTNDITNTIEEGDEKYKIFLLAKQSGFDGTYEEWLESIKGDFIQMRVSNADLEWKYSKDTNWTKLISLTDLVTSIEPKEIELSTSATHIVWKYEGENGWHNLVELSSLVGNEGKSAYDIAKEVGFNGTVEEWINSLKGEKGDTGNGIVKTEIDENGDLIVTYTDGKVVNVGKVINDNVSSYLEFYPYSDNTYGVSAGKALYLDEITIPETYNGKPVTRINPGAFHVRDNNCGVKSLIIPSSITKVGREAFYYSPLLTKVYYYGTKEQYETTLKNNIGDGNWSLLDANWYFYTENGSSETKDGLYWYYDDEGKIKEVINEFIVKFETFGGTEIANNYTKEMFVVKPNDPYKDNYLFDGWYSDAELTKEYDFNIKIDKNITLYAKYVQALDYRLSNDKTYYSVASIGSYNGTEVIIPKTYKGLYITTIEDYSFADCEHITNIIIPSSIKKIGDRAFYTCYSLQEVYNLSSLNIQCDSSENGGVGYYAVKIYTSLDEQSILYKDENGYVFACYDDKYYLVRYEGNENNLVLPNEFNYFGKLINSYEIHKFTFYNNDTLTSVTIPNSVTSIEECAFGNCTSLESIKYEGTISEWNSIKTDNSWLLGTNVGGVECEDGNTSNDGSIFHICVWNEEFKGFFEKYVSDEKDKFVEASEKKDDSLKPAETHYKGIKVKWTIVPSDNGAYQTALDAALVNNENAKEEDKIDLFLAESDYIMKYTNSNYTKDITKMGVVDFSNIYNYTKQVATNSSGGCKGVCFQCCPSGVIYRRSIAQKVLGVSNPEDVQAALSDWTKFDSVAAQMKSQGYYMTASFAETYRAFYNNVTKPWVDSSNKLQFDDQINKWMDQADSYIKNGYSLTAGIWENECTNEMYADGKAFCYFGPAWYYNFCMFNAQDSTAGCYGDWAFIPGPASHFWGGTWIVAPQGGDNDNLVADTMNAFINDYDICYNLVTKEGQFSNNQKVNVAVAKEYDASGTGNTFLGGQNDIAIQHEIAKECSWNNRTIYDQYCNEGLQNNFQQYLKGEVTKDKAIANFKDYIVRVCQDVKINNY